jgi:hypothetical protein
MQQSAPPPAARQPQQPPPASKQISDGSLVVSRDGVPNVEELLALMRSPVADDRLGALELLAGVVENSFGEGGAELGSAVRAGGGVASLSALLFDRSPEIQQQAPKGGGGFPIHSQSRKGRRGVAGHV